MMDLPEFEVNEPPPGYGSNEAGPPLTRADVEQVYHESLHTHPGPLGDVYRRMLALVMTKFVE